MKTKIDPAKLSVAKTGKNELTNLPALYEKNQNQTVHNLIVNKSLPELIIEKYPLKVGQDGVIYAVLNDGGNDYAVKVDSKLFKYCIRNLAKKHHFSINNAILKEIIEYLTAHAESHDEQDLVWTRVAKWKDGIILDLGDKTHTQVQIMPEGYELIRDNSCVLFQRTSTMLSWPKPEGQGDLSLLDKYLNLYPVDILMLKAYLTYTLAAPKLSSTNYLILVLQGDQGSGKSFLNKIIKLLLDPSRSIIQSFPRNEKDLAIAAQQNHVLCIDNLRHIKPGMADLLCMTSTGGMSNTRQLYTDSDQLLHNLHVALILSGIHPFIDQPDLAQRCLTMTLKPMEGQERRTESVMIEEFSDDYPEIFTGLLELTSKILKALPDVKPMISERMIDFCYWLAALEEVYGVPNGVYQKAYADFLNEAQLDTLLDDPLAAAILDYLDHHRELYGTPTDVFDDLTRTVNKRTQNWHLWPRNAIGFSKRLQSLKAGLLSQDIEVIVGRGKYRELTIRKIKEEQDNG